MKQTHHYLSITSAQLLEFHFELWERYCANISKKTNVEFQKLWANTALCNYFRVQLRELESEFNSFASRNTNLSKKHLTQNYDIIVVEIHTHFPSALIEAAKKLTIINPPINSN